MAVFAPSHLIGFITAEIFRTLLSCWLALLYALDFKYNFSVFLLIRLGFHKLQKFPRCVVSNWHLFLRIVTSSEPWEIRSPNWKFMQREWISEKKPRKWLWCLENKVQNHRGPNWNHQKIKRCKLNVFFWGKKAGVRSKINNLYF